MPPEILDVCTLSRRIASGDTEAFAVFYEAWFNFCTDEVHRMTALDEAACMDVVQDVMLKIAPRFPVVETVGDLERWMRRVLINGARDRLRAEARRAVREHRAHPAPPARERKALEDLRTRLDTLDSEACDLLRRRFDLGWTLERIGRELGLRPGAVDGRINRILKKLRGGST